MTKATQIARNAGQSDLNRPLRRPAGEGAAARGRSSEEGAAVARGGGDGVFAAASRACEAATMALARKTSWLKPGSAFFAYSDRRHIPQSNRQGRVVEHGYQETAGRPGPYRATHFLLQRFGFGRRPRPNDEDALGRLYLGRGSRLGRVDAHSGRFESALNPLRRGAVRGGIADEDLAH